MIRRSRMEAGVSVPVATPIQPSVVYASDSIAQLHGQYEGGAFGHTYSREGHPNAAHLAAMISALEGAEHGLMTGSGMAAVTAALLGACQAGDHVIGGDQLYGRSLRLMKEELPRAGIATTLVDATDTKAVETAIRPETKLMLVEVVANPTLRVADIEGIAKLCKDRGILLAIDNTFTTPRGFQALEAGADIVIHSVTKLLAGHSDAMLGFVSARDPELQARIETLVVTMGLTPSPFDCWLGERGLYSFELRYDRAEENAKRLAEALANTAGVARVVYPGRPDHPDHNRIAALLGDRTGNMVTFDLDGDETIADRMVRALEAIPFAPTLGDIGTTVSHPRSSSHRALTDAERHALGITDASFRVSVGVESVDQLTTEFRSAIAAAVS